MGLFSGFRAAQLVDAQTRLAEEFVPVPRAAHTISAAHLSGLWSSGVTLDAAMSVPAFSRGLTLLCGVAAGFPLVPWTDHRPQLMRGAGLSRDVVDALMISNTVRDIVCYGRAAWVVSDNHARRVRADQLQRDERAEIWADDPWQISGYTRTQIPGDLLVFDTGVPGVLEHGWSTLQTAILLERVAQRLARSPMPTTVLKSRGLDLDEDQATELVSSWDRAREQNSTAYLSSLVDADAMGFNSAELQLVEARNHAATEVARVLGIAAFWVDAGVPGSSLTYQNREDQNQNLLDTAVMPRLRIIEQTLSRYTNATVRFDTTNFLRSNFSSRADVLTKYLAAGIITVAEAREWEPLVKEGIVPE